MPRLPTTASPALRAIEERHDKLRELFLEQFPLLQTLRARALSELVPTLTATHKLQDDGIQKLQGYLDDIPSLFRHAKRAKFHEENTLQALRETLDWRITSEVDNLDVDELHPLYVDPPSVARALRGAGGPDASPTTTEPIANRPPLLWLNDRLLDHYGRPCGVISLRTLERTEERNLENLKEYILASVEIIRRQIAELYAKSEPLPYSAPETPGNSPIPDHKLTANNGRGNSGAEESDEDGIAARPRSGPLQMVLACDLEGAGMSNLEIELLPFLLDLLKKHYPGHIAVMYLLHYGWVHAGMWTLAKRVLPQPVLDKIVFPKDDGSPLEEGGKRGEIEDHFDRRRWPRALGKCGAWIVPLDEGHNSVMRRFSSSITKRPRSRSGSRHSSRSSSFVNLHQLGAFTPMDERGNALGPWAAVDAPGGAKGLGISTGGPAGALPSQDDSGHAWYGGSSQPPVRRRWRDLFRTLTYLFVLRILTLNRRMRRRVVNIGRVVGRSLVTGGQGEADEQGERWSRHETFVHSSNASGPSRGGNVARPGPGSRQALPALQMSSNLQAPASPLLSPGGRSPTGRSNVRYPTGWGQLNSPRPEGRGSSLTRWGSVTSANGQARSLSLRRGGARFVWRSSMRWMRSFTLFALIVALFQSDWRTGLPKGTGMATLWDSVRAAAILRAGTAALRS
ncbi:hypothetical protein V8E36_009590 [Tilletia maclaganii]